jgi:hypothetical protein
MKVITKRESREIDKTQKTPLVVSSLPVDPGPVDHEPHRKKAAKMRQELCLQ